jgi:hypothetical protein
LEEYYLNSDITTQIISSTTDLSHYPDIYAYDSVRKESFWILEVAAKEFDADRLMPNQISRILIEKFEISRSSRTVGSALGKAANDGLVDKNSIGFKLMKKGREELLLTESNNPGVFYIEPGKPFSSKLLLFDDILSTMENRVWICDPYIDARLLDILHNIDVSIEIRIMTIRVHKEDVFKRTLADFKKEHTNTEVRIAPPGELHDRYILSDSGMWLVGHSLKDLGTKESFIVKLDEDIKKSMESVFTNRWSVSNNFN